MPTDQDTWPYREVVKDTFWSAVSELNLGAIAPLKGDDEAYQTLFETMGEGLLISPRSLLGMHVEKAEAAWLAIHFESKSQSNLTYDARGG